MVLNNEGTTVENLLFVRFKASPPTADGVLHKKKYRES